MGYFGVTKTLNILHKHFYWPNMKKDIEYIYAKCIARRQAMSRSLPYTLYTPLPIPMTPWIDIFMNFVWGCLGLEKVLITYLTWWTSLLKWHTLLFAIK